MEKRIILVAFDGAQTLDITGPAEVFAIAALVLGTAAYKVVLASSRGGEIVTAASGLSITTTALAQLACRVDDTVLVAGGLESDVKAAASDPRLLEWLQHHGGKAHRIGSVCSGAFVLAAAGLLDGRTVATHWYMATQLASFRPTLSVDANAIFVQDGRVWTSAGVTTGIDMSLAMVEEDFGRQVADRVAAQLVLHARRPGFQSQFSDLLAAQARRDDPLSDVLAWASAHLHALDVEVLAQRAGVSVRTLHRLCASSLGTTPAKLIERLH